MSSQSFEDGSPERTQPEPESGSPERGRSSSDADRRRESAEGPEERRPLTQQEQARAVSELLRGRGGADHENDDAPESDGEDALGPEDDEWRPTPEEDEDAADGEESGSRGHAKPTSMADAAEKLGISPEELYALGVTIGDGEAVPLGKLKDAWKDRDAAARESAKRAAELDEREGAITADRLLWETIAHEAQAKLSPETRQRLAQAQEKQTAEYTRNLVTAMPELRDDDTRAAFGQAVGELLKSYGVEPSQFRFTDHRQVLILRDLMRTKSRLAKLLAYSPDKAPPRSAKPQGRGDARHRQSQLLKRAEGGTTAQKVEAISSLIRE